MKQSHKLQTRVYVPTKSAEDWRELLADPEKQWKTGYSAKTLAYCWEDADGFPNSVAAVLKQRFPAVEPLFIVPEHQVALPGGGAKSQCDVWVLAKSGDDLISMAIEGKCKEPFGPSVGEWLRQVSPGKIKRLDYIKELLNLVGDVDTIRYQLLHRTAAAIVEAVRFYARHAVMLVHSFGGTDENFEDYQEFGSALNLRLERGQIISMPPAQDLQLHIAWVDGEKEFLKK